MTGVPASTNRSVRGTAVRLFLTCWLVYGLHFATDIQREIYPALALGDRFSFALDEYAGLHPDLFEVEGRGWRQGNNPGVSFLAAVPYVLARPIIDPIVARVQARRASDPEARPPEYDTPWENDRRFFRLAWERGLDVKLGLAAFAVQLLFMAPLCALSAVLVFHAARHVLSAERTALWVSLLYAFGTPVFYRASYLNHNMALGVLAFLAFLVMWDPGDSGRFSYRGRFVIGGLGGGAAVLFDYSGIIFLAALFLYGVALLWKDHAANFGGRLSPGRSPAALLRGGLWYAVGAAGPIALLCFYQWRAFGNPFLPGQHWMPPVQWIDEGYQGYGLPQLELFRALAFDHRYGLFAFAPILFLGLLGPLVDRRPRRLPGRETWFVLLTFVALWVFFAGNNYTRLQFVTGVRYMAPIVPFLFLPAAAVFLRLPPRARYFGFVFSVTLTWCLTMYREIQLPLGVLDPVLRTFIHGFELPALRTLERMGGAYGGFAADGSSSIPLLLVAAAIVYGIWAFPRRRAAERAGAPRPTAGSRIEA